MKPIIDRVVEFVSNMTLQPDPNYSKEENNYIHRIYRQINKEYFNNTLDIELILYNAEDCSYLIKINGVVPNTLDNYPQILDYLQNLYDLQCLKRKCQNITQV